MHERFIAPENIPVEYGGLEQESSELSEGHGKFVHCKVRPGTVERIEIPVPQVLLIVIVNYILKHGFNLNDKINLPNVLVLVVPYFGVRRT